MAPRASWKGYLKLSLVSCPVRMYTATSSTSRVSFNLLHKDTHNRIRMRPYDPELGEVDRADLVKGYEYDKDQYVIMSDEDFDKIKIESTDTMAIERFVDESKMDPIYLDSPYYLTPDGAVGEEAFRVIHEAMRRKKKVAISRVVISGRERAIAMSVRDKGFLVSTLRTAEEVRDQSLYFDDIGSGTVEKDLLQLASQLIDQKTGAFDPAMFKDRYQQAVQEVVKAKLRGQEPVVAKAPDRGKVINLMDALKQSLEGEAMKPPAPSRRRAAGEKERQPRRRKTTASGGSG